jgi:hypothetical protein
VVWADFARNQDPGHRIPPFGRLARLQDSLNTLNIRGFDSSSWHRAGLAMQHLVFIVTGFFNVLCFGYIVHKLMHHGTQSPTRAGVNHPLKAKRFGCFSDGPHNSTIDYWITGSREQIIDRSTVRIAIHYTAFTQLRSTSGAARRTFHQQPTDQGMCMARFPLGTFSAFWSGL